MATLRFLVLTIAIFGAALINPSLADYGDDDELNTSFIFKWHGGFIGDIEIPIEHEIDGWNMTITFEKNIFEFEICPAEVVDIEDKKVFHLRSRPWNSRLHAEDTLEMWFNAKTWRKIRGLVGIIDFEPNILPSRNDTNMTESSDMSSEFSSSGGGYNNNLTCDGVNNVTCGSSFELVSGSGSGPFVAEVQMNVDFGDIESTVVDLTTNVPFIYIILETDFQQHLEVDGKEIPFSGVLTTENSQKHILIINMNEKLEEAGHGRLVIQFRFVTMSSDISPVIFPHIADTVECQCTRLVVV